MSRHRSLATVGVSSDHACDQCSAIAVTIEATPLGYALLCERCGLPKPSACSAHDVLETVTTRRAAVDQSPPTFEQKEIHQ